MAVSVPTIHAQAFEPDERQREAIEHVHGPILVVAGAGTGKTTVLIRRIAHLIREGHARAEEILAVTYTKNAAEEMRERVLRELQGENAAGLQVHTFHDYCNGLLARAGKQFGVLDEKDLWIFLRRRIRELRLNHFIRAADLGKFLNDLLTFMRRCQDELVGPEKYAGYVRRLERGELPLPRVSKKKDAHVLTDEEVLSRCQEIAQVFAIVEGMLREENLGTFGHMITGAYELLQDSRQLERARERSRFILVDEFQDANYAQVKILRLLAGDERNVFAVGDPDQAIYQFRGASSAAFGLFQHHFPGARLVKLEKNRRSTTPILRTAFAVIQKNPEAFAGDSQLFSAKRTPLVSAREEDALREGKPPVNLPVEAAISVGKEAESLDVAAAIQRRRRESHCKWRQIAVLYRQHTHRDKVAEELAAQGIPFSIENMDVMHTPEVRDLFACLGAIVSERDGASLFRVAALPQFAVDPDKLREGMKALPKDVDQNAGVATVLAQIEGGSTVLDALQQAGEEIVRVNAKSRAAAEIVIRGFSLDPASRPLSAVLDFIAAWEEKAVTKTKDLAELLEYLEYFREAGGAIPMTSHEQDAVALMTAHTAKGLEWDHVFILRAISNSFPCSYKPPLFEFPTELREDDSVSQKDGQTLHEQEERRLFYVAMTRARDSLTLYAQQGRGRKDPTPPGYIRELLANSEIRQWFRKREAQAFAGELFGEAAIAPPLASRASQWLQRPPTSNLKQRLSATAVEIYETCPLRFKLEREWRIPRDVPAALQYGAAMHRVLKTYYDAVRQQRPLAEDALIQLFRDDLAAAGIQDRYQYELYDKQGIMQLREFLSQSQCRPMPEVLHTEEWFEMPVGDATVAGRIDRMDRSSDGRIVVTDYKTGKPKAQEDADKSLQLSIYALAAHAKWGYDVDALVLYNLEGNAPVVTRRDRLQLEEAKLKVEDVARRIAAGDFRAKSGFHCNFCPYHNLCPATEKRLYATTGEKTTKRRDARRSGKS
jgi:superfamily I DNA/RNA helicase/RecB family exonuclease